jgi:hypothetical protein
VSDLIQLYANANIRIGELERENAALKTALDHQMNYQRELRADKDRLDWLDKTGCWLLLGHRTFRHRL